MATSQFAFPFPQPVVSLIPVTVAALPASPTQGMVYAVSDSTTIVWGATITGAGTNPVLAYYDGTNWTVAGK